MVQYLSAVYGNRDTAGVFDVVFYHFSRRLIEDNVSRIEANTFCLMKMFIRAREN
jgi:hypothetical protein